MIFWSWVFFWEHALAYPQPQLTDLWQSRGHNLYCSFRKCGGRPALKAGTPHPEGQNRALLHDRNGMFTSLLCLCHVTFHVPAYYHVNYCKAARALVQCERYAPMQMFNYYCFCIVG